VEKLYDNFFKNLKKRFALNDVLEISEDCIRYDYFLSLSSAIESQNIILEYPFNKMEIDCVIKHSDKLEAIEFKFFRPIPSGKNNPQTQLLGDLFKDIYKLIAFKNVDIRKIILVANKRMTNYINNKFSLFDNINHSIVINIKEELLNNQEKTFQNNIKPFENIELNIERVFCNKFIENSNEYFVGIYNIKA
jgi:hypothetical protein